VDTGTNCQSIDGTFPGSEWAISWFETECLDRPVLPRHPNKNFVLNSVLVRTYGIA
jgi:hypothetical protein